MLVQAARLRILHLGGRALGPRCAASVKELICDLVVEPQPIGRDRCAGSACRVIVEHVGSSTAATRGWAVRPPRLAGDGWSSGEPLSPARAAYSDELMPSAHRRRRMDWQVIQSAARRRAGMLVEAGISSTTRRTTLRRKARTRCVSEIGCIGDHDSLIHRV